MTATANYDVIIIGAGMVGATLACLCAQQARKVAIIENYLPAAFEADKTHDLRVSAISRASQKAFEQIGAWQDMQAMRVSPYQSMHVWDAAGEGEIHFDAAELGEPDLGHIIENRVVQLALLEVIKQDDNIDLISSAAMHGFEVKDEQVELQLANNLVIRADLLVGADGAYSKVRELSGLGLEQNDYGQCGLVAVVQTELPHDETAWQRFLPGGPLALLPLSDGTCSIVWTLPADKADYYRQMPEDDFNRAITEAFAHRLGEIKVVSDRASFPLIGRHAEHYVTDRVALVGDAAHTIHPLAGQGVNLGIKDAVELAQIIAAAKGDLGGYKLLRRYERARKGDNVLTQKSMEGFRILFGHTLPLIKAARNFGLNLVNKLTPIKNEIMRKAMGI